MKSSRYISHSVDRILSNEGLDCKRPRRTRTVFSDDALEALEDAFEENCYPDVFQRCELAREIGEEESRIQVWFQNRRARSKRQQKFSNNERRKSSSSRDLSSSSSSVKSAHTSDQLSRDTYPPISPYFPFMPAYVIPVLPYTPSWSPGHTAIMQTPSGMVPPLHSRFEPSSPLWSPGFSPSFKKIFDFPPNPLSPLPTTPEVSRHAEEIVSTFRITKNAGDFAERVGPDSVSLRVPSKTSSIYTPLHVPGIPAPPPRSRDTKDVSGLDDLSPADSAYSSASGSVSELQTTHLESPTTPPGV